MFSWLWIDLLSNLNVGEAIYGGKWVIMVSYFGFVVHKEIHDFCEEVSCPVAAGSFVVANTQKLPAFAPPVSFSLPNISF